jgi:O-antigen/teichoic acid export membrane protein
MGESNPHYLFFCLQVACFLFGLKFLEASLLSIYQGFKRYDLAAKWSVGSRLLILVANVICAILGYGLSGILVCTLCIQFLYLVLLFFFIKSNYSFLSLYPNFSLKGSKTFLSFGLWSWVQNMLAVFTTQVDKLIVVSTAGLQTLTYYSVGSMIAMQFHSIFISTSNWVFPAVSERVAKKESLVDFYAKAQALLLFFGFASLISFLVLEKYILTMWLGSFVYEQAGEFIRVFVYYNFFLILMIMPYFFLNGSNNLKQNTLSEFVLKALNIIFMVIFYNLMGTIGLVWGIVISTALVVPYKIMQVNKYVLFRNPIFFNIEAILCSVLLVGVFQLPNVYVKIVCFLLFLAFFYFLFLRKASLSAILKNGIK